MRVFCPQHKIGFFTPRRNPVRCENRGHVLGEFNFHGDAKMPVETLWQYCCNCEHFCPIELDQGGLGVCPACSRGISQRYMCDRCFTVSLESSTATQAKNFRLTSDGAPQPSCPGCLQESSGDLHEHDCEKLGPGFKTGLNSCPICLEHLDVGPLFPSSVTQYLRKTKTANKLNVAFDYTSGLFLPVENGEFVLVSNGSQNSRPFVLPRSPRFESKRDFYELYQDYYHCSNIDAGEVHVIEPAFVERVQAGWKLQSIGVLEIVGVQATTDVIPGGIPPRTEFPVRERSALFSACILEEPAAIEEQSAAIHEPPGVTCADCGARVQTGYAFCWNCGHSTEPNAAAPKQTKQTILSSHRVLANDDEATIQHEVAHVQPTIFSWAAPQPSESVSTPSRLKLIAIVVIGLLSVVIGGFLLKGLLSQFGRSAESQQVTSNLHTVPSAVPKVEPTVNATAEIKAASNPTINHAEEELRKLRERRMSASSSDRLTILQLFANTERQYPDDYRFPYERAKLAINGIETRSHDEAFNALALAAGTAIKADKADEMLKGLEADRMSDFHKLSHGHREWMQIIEALKRKDATLLASN